MSEGRNLNIPVVAVGAAVLWVVAFGLLMWDTAYPAEFHETRAWSLMTAIAAAAWTSLAGTVCIARATANRIVRRIQLHDEASRLTKI